MKQYENLITLYGRKPVRELLMDNDVKIFRLHLADSNANSEIMREIEQLANSRNIEIKVHSKRELSRISKNSKQDQGVAIDVKSERYRSIESLSEDLNNSLSDEPVELIAVDRITNPQNLGMIIRSVAASPMHGLLLPKKGCAKIDPLVFKSSAGTLIKTNIYHCDELTSGITQLKERGFEVLGLAGGSNTSLSSLEKGKHRLFIVGNESEGLSESVQSHCDRLLSIPMNAGVESINVVAAATLVAFRTIF